MPENQLRHREAVRRQLFEHVDARRVALRLRLLDDRVVQLLEEDVAELLRRVDVELRAGLFVDALLEVGELRAHRRRHLAQQIGVDADAALLHPREHGEERHLDASVDVDERGVAAQLGLEHFVQRDRDVGFIAEVVLKRREPRGADFVIELEERRRFLNFLAHEDVALEAITGDVAEGVAGEAGVDDVGHQHHVGPALRHGIAARAQPALLRFGVVGDEHAIALQQLAQRGLERRFVRNDERLRRAQRQRHGHRRIEAFVRGGLDPDRERRVAFHELAYFVCRRGNAVLGRDRRRRRQILLHQRRELETREKLVQLRAIGLAALERIEVDGDVEIALDARELAREKRLVAIVLERFFLRRAFDLIEVLVHAFQRAELADERLRALLADAGNAGDVVDRIAPDRHHVDDFLRRQTEHFDDAVRVVQRLAAGVIKANAVADELEKILVARRDHDVVAAIARRAGERADEIVRLPFRRTDHRNAKALEHLVNERYLHDQIVRHRPAIFLVVRILRRAHRLPPLIERNGDAIGIEVLQQHPQRGGEAVDRVGGKTRGVGQIADGEVGAIDVVGAVDDEETGAFLGHGGGL